MVLLILLYSFLYSAEFETREPSGRWLVELKASGADCLDHWWSENKLDQTRYTKRKLPLGNWFAIELPSGFSGSLKDLPCVIDIREDRKIQWRDTEPNDPSYINQNDMDLIGMPSAWDMSTGGVTAQGDTIVVAVIDFGFQPDHTDLKDNVWKNRHEVTGDNIDNDDNGYVDDYKGVNILNGGDAHLPGIHHGTAVMGIIGGKGNNTTGIAGVNWNVKMMIISGADYESQLIEAYDYVVQMRRKYRFTNGAEGAFVVATNLSGGVDFAFAVDHPLWCEMYDKLGEEGVLSVVAAPNKDISVDIEGDMPTTCTSPFMIAVTNVDISDALVLNAGYGSVSIDIGAPGHGSISTTGNHQYKEFPGTSAAAPHVTGTVALLYSTPCHAFLQNVNSDPDGIALLMKDIIFKSGTSNNTLQDITVTGKRLQTDAALRKTVTLCDSLLTPSINIVSVGPNPAVSDFINIVFEVVGDTSQAVFDLYTTNGSLVESYKISAEEFAQGHITVHTRDLASGLYFITLRSKKLKATAKLFVK